MHIKQKVEQEIAKQDFTKIIEAEKKYYLKKLIPEVYRNINLEIKDIDIKIEIGTENVILTSFIVPCISTILAFFIKEILKLILYIKIKIL